MALYSDFTNSITHSFLQEDGLKEVLRLDFCNKFNSNADFYEFDLNLIRNHLDMGELMFIENICTFEKFLLETESTFSDLEKDFFSFYDCFSQSKIILANFKQDFFFNNIVKELSLYNLFLLYNLAFKLYDRLVYLYCCDHFFFSLFDFCTRTDLSFCYFFEEFGRFIFFLEFFSANLGFFLKHFNFYHFNEFFKFFDDCFFFFSHEFFNFSFDLFFFKNFIYQQAYLFFFDTDSSFFFDFFHNFNSLDVLENFWHDFSFGFFSVFFDYFFSFFFFGYEEDFFSSSFFQENLYKNSFPTNSNFFFESQVLDMLSSASPESQAWEVLSDASDASSEFQVLDMLSNLYTLEDEGSMSVINGEIRFFFKDFIEDIFFYFFNSLNFFFPWAFQDFSFLIEDYFFLENDNLLDANFLLSSIDFDLLEVFFHDEIFFNNILSKMFFTFFDFDIYADFYYNSLSFENLFLNHNNNNLSMDFYPEDTFIFFEALASFLDGSIDFDLDTRLQFLNPDFSFLHVLFSKQFLYFFFRDFDLSIISNNNFFLKKKIVFFKALSQVVFFFSKHSHKKFIDFSNINFLFNLKFFIELISVFSFPFKFNLSRFLEED